MLKQAMCHTQIKASFFPLLACLLLMQVPQARAQGAGSIEKNFADSLTAVLTPPGHDADHVRAVAAQRYGVALGRGLGALQGRVFRIGHMGDLNEPMLLGCLATTELAMKTAGVPFAPGGVDAAIESLAR